jgi:hypothetical protein
MSPEDRFVATEPFDRTGEKGEYLVWEKVREAWRDRDCLAYWRYPIFARSRQVRKEPDILICDRHLGLIVIEVKSIKINQIVSIDGHFWQYRDFYSDYGNPYQQAENQLFSLLDYTKNEPHLHDRITARAITSLPFITSQQWHDQGFNNVPFNPPIIFQDYLDRSANLIETIFQINPVVKGEKISQMELALLLRTIARTKLFSQHS